ncbi:hypothetical protein EBR96_02845 [bacterium]|nr:hypothetical protein [bacterium]
MKWLPLVLMLAVPLNAAVEVTQDVTPRHVRIGDRMAYECIVKHPSGVPVKRITATAIGYPFSVMEYKKSTSREGNESLSKSTATLIPFDVGTFVIPTQEIQYTESGKTKVVVAPAIEIVVDSMLSPTLNQIRDIKPLVAVPVPETAIWAVSVAGIVIVLGVAGLVIMNRRGGELDMVPTSIDSGPIDVVSRALLTELNREGYSSENADYFFSRLSEIMRRFIAVRFDIPAAELTTRETEIRLLGIIPDEVGERLHLVLAGCDLVKFAGVRPSEADWNVLSNHGLTVIGELGAPETEESDAVG